VTDRKEDFPGIFRRLRPLLAKHSAGLVTTHDGEDHYALDTPHIMKNGGRLFFGAVQVKKAYVSFHLMPVYSDPDLLSAVSDTLKKRMQGKSCFNFRKLDENLIAELEKLVDDAAERYRAHGYF